MPPRMLVAERGLRDTRRNRRWLALVRLLDDEIVGGQERCERLAWKLLKTYEETP